MGNLRVKKDQRNLGRWNKESQLHEAATIGTHQRVYTEGTDQVVPPRGVDFENMSGSLSDQLINQREEFASGTVGQEAVIADVTKITIRDMSDESSDEI